MIFLRAVNVGGHAVVRSNEVAERLARYDVVSVGAAGSFLARRAPGDDALRAAVRSALGFDTAIMLLSEPEARRLLTDGPAEWLSPPPACRRFVSLLGDEPGRTPRLPLAVPATGRWDLKVVGLQGRAALTLRRIPTGAPLEYPNPVVEKAFGVPATTRGLDTVESLLARAG